MNVNGNSLNGIKKNKDVELMKDNVENKKV
jgi:hypothetical protein